MRLATLLAVASLPLTLLAHPAAAQIGVPLYYDGLVHTPLGGATLTNDPVARRLTVSNIGSSGQDIGSIDLGYASSGGGIGHSIAWDALADLGPGASFTVTNTGTAASGTLTVASKLTITRNSDGSETITADYSGVGAASMKVVLLNASGQVLGIATKPVQVAFQMTALPGSGVASEGYQSSWPSPSSRWTGVRYRNPVSVSLGGGSGGSTVCSEIRFVCDSGNPVTTMKTATLNAMASPGGVLRITHEGVQLQCSACVGLQGEAGWLSAIGEAHYGNGSSSAGERRLPVNNLGSSGLDGVSVSAGRLATALGVTLDESPLAPGLLRIRARGVVNGTNVPIGDLQCFIQPDRIEFQPDFTAVGASGYRLILKSGGGVVADIPNPVGRASQQLPATKPRVQVDTETASGVAQLRIICITEPCPRWTVTANGALYLVDEIVFQPFGLSPGVSGFTVPNSISSMSLLAVGSELPLFDANVRSTAPTVGVDLPGSSLDFAGARLSPNPATGAVQVVFAMPQAADARVSVVDIAGRQVRELANGKLAAGAHALSWDGRDVAGRPSAAGVYFVRIEAESSTRVARMIRLR